MIPVVVAGLVLGACGQSADAPAGAGGAFADRLAANVAEATSAGASEDQLDLLDRARDQGEVTVEIARQAWRALAECAAAADVEVTFEERTRPDGWVTAVTRVDGTRPDAEQVFQSCERKEAFWVSTLYSTQPAAEQATSDYLDQQAPVLSACLKGAGFEPEPGDTGMDLAMLSTRASDQAMREAGFNCLQQIGVDGF